MMNNSLSMPSPSTLMISSDVTQIEVGEAGELLKFTTNLA
jgi:hypothetical protein